MKRRSFALSFFIFALLVNTLPLFGQTSGDWASLKALPAGIEVRVETKTKKRFDGALKSVSDTTITVAAETGTEAVEKSEVSKVFRINPRSRGTSGAIGAAIGAGIAAGLGFGMLLATGGSDNSGAVVGPIIATGAGVGGALGALFPGKKRTLIFKSK